MSHAEKCPTCNGKRKIYVMKYRPNGVEFPIHIDCPECVETIEPITTTNNDSMVFVNAGGLQDAKGI